MTQDVKKLALTKKNIGTRIGPAAPKGSVENNTERAHNSSGDVPKLIRFLQKKLCVQLPCFLSAFFGCRASIVDARCARSCVSSRSRHPMVDNLYFHTFCSEPAKKNTRGPPPPRRRAVRKIAQQQQNHIYKQISRLLFMTRVSCDPEPSSA